MSDSPTLTPVPTSIDASGVRLRTRRESPATTVVAASGDIDAANAAEFATLALAYPPDTSALTVDLSEVEFFGAAGFSALHAIGDRCAADGIRWAVVPSAAVSRLLRICDPQSAMPTRPAVDERLLELIAEPR